MCGVRCFGEYLRVCGGCAVKESRDQRVERSDGRGGRDLESGIQFLWNDVCLEQYADTS